MNAYLTFWVWFEDVSLITDDRGIFQLEFGNQNNANQSFWNTDSAFNNIVVQDGWNFFRVDFTEDTYIDKATINWSEIDYIQFYARNNSATKSRVLIDDMRIHNTLIRPQIGSAYEFNGTRFFNTSIPGNQGDPQSISFEKIQNLDYTNNFTISFFANINSYNAPSGTRGILAWGFNGGFQTQSDGKLHFGTRNVSGGTSIREILTPINLNQWYHITGTYSNETGNISLYLDGEFIETKLSDNFFNLSLSSFNMGNSVFSGNTASLKGSVDELMIFNRTLSATEIKQIFEATSNQKGFQVNARLSIFRKLADIFNLENAVSRLQSLFKKIIQGLNLDNFIDRIQSLFKTLNQKLFFGNFQVPTEGLVSWWTMDYEDTFDLNISDVQDGNDGVVNGYTFNHGNITGATLNQTNTFHRKAYEFDGVDDIITIND